MAWNQVSMRTNWRSEPGLCLKPMVQGCALKKLVRRFAPLKRGPALTHLFRFVSRPSIQCGFIVSAAQNTDLQAWRGTQQPAHPL